MTRNSFCSYFTLKFANDSGNIILTVTMPKTATSIFLTFVITRVIKLIEERDTDYKTKSY